MSFKFANVDARSRGGGSAWISIKQGKSYVGMSAAFVEEMGAENGDRLTLAFDDDMQPWVGLVPSDCPEAGPKLQIREYDDKMSRHLSSERFVLQMRRCIPNGVEKRVRFTLSQDTQMIEHPKTGSKVHLHRLIVPDAEPTDE